MIDAHSRGLYRADQFAALSGLDSGDIEAVGDLVSRVESGLLAFPAAPGGWDPVSYAGRTSVEQVELCAMISREFTGNDRAEDWVRDALDDALCIRGVPVGNVADIAWIAASALTWFIGNGVPVKKFLGLS